LFFGFGIHAALAGEKAAHGDEIVDMVVIICRSENITGQPMAMDSGRDFFRKPTVRF
jgi:hypothetical protein